MFKLKQTSLSIATALALAGASVMATADNAPAPPPFYDAGPTNFLVNDTDMTLSERKAYAGLEAVMTVLESYVHAFGCTPAEYPVSVIADFTDFDAAGNPDLFNNVVVDNFEMFMDLQPNMPGRGQTVAVTSFRGVIGGRDIGAYDALFTYNDDNNIMDGQWALTLFGRNRPDRYSGIVIKDFYLGEDDTTTTGIREDDILYDWGLQSVRKEGKPVEKWWQRSKSRRDNFVIGKTVFQKDRLVGQFACRIVVDVEGDNNSDVFWQDGTATIARLLPSDPSPELDAVTP